MRHLWAIALASLAAIACGTSPDGAEPSASTSQEVVINPNPGGTCAPGYLYECHNMGGHQICGCQLLSCNFNYVAPASGSWWFESWTTGSVDGSCPDVQGTNGTWKELSTASSCDVAGAFYGVPCEYRAYPPYAAAGCDPKKFGTPSCCTYVWWPAKYQESTTCAPYSNTCQNSDSSWEQDPQALCKYEGMTLWANVAGSCTQPPCGGSGGCRTCGNQQP